MGGGKTVSGKTAEPCLKTGREEADAVSTCGFHKGFQIQSIRKNVKVPEARFLILSLTRVKLQKYAAAAAAESLSRVRLCVTPGSFVPGILQARALKWVAISFSNA